MVKVNGLVAFPAGTIFPPCPGGILLHLHFLLKAFLVYLKALFVQNLNGQINGETVGIIKLKCLFAVQNGFLFGVELVNIFA